MWTASAPLRACAPELAWIDAAHLHLTIKFLGEQPEERCPEIVEAVARVAGQHREFGMEVGGVGAFPNFRRARVVWVGVAQDAKLELVHHDVEVACDALGIDVE
ncbi:MAG: RNA 2',3'-cyclic phosphodiesterase, partial [Gemmatimonadaceae bacterium]